MSRESGDAGISRLIRQVAGQGVTPKRQLQLREKLGDALTKVPEGIRPALKDAFLLVGRMEVLDASPIELLNSLTAAGYAECSAALLRFAPAAFDKATFPEMRAGFPNATSVAQWVKRTRQPKKKLLSDIDANAPDYYGTAWCDWYIKNAPVKKLLAFADFLLDQKERPSYLSTPQNLLCMVLKRDRKFAVALDLRMLALPDSRRVKVLIEAAITLPHVALSYADDFGRGIAAGSTEERQVLEVLMEMVRGRSSSAAAMFGAHAATARALMSNSPESEESGLVELAPYVWLLSRERATSRYWISITTEYLERQILQAGGKISLEGATQFALALREGDKGADVTDVLWSTAFNLGVRETGEPRTMVRFDAALHEDIEGGLLPGNEAVVVFRGWEFQGKTIVRAQVRKV